MERLLARYTDRERVLNLTRINSVADLPDEFYAQVEGVQVCKVSVNWLGIKRSISKVLREIAKRSGRESELTPERLERTIDVAAGSATLYVLEFMPEVLDLALSHLCLEAQMAKSAHLVRSRVDQVRRRDFCKD
jgi:hypothetical protein